MAWIYVVLAGIIEIFWVLGLKYAETLPAFLLVILLIVASFYVLAKAFESLPVSIVYAVFTGIGTAGIVLVEMIFFGQPLSILKCLFTASIICGVIGLKLTTKEISADTAENAAPNTTPVKKEGVS